MKIELHRYDTKVCTALLGTASPTDGTPSLPTGFGGPDTMQTQREVRIISAQPPGLVLSRLSAWPCAALGPARPAAQRVTSAPRRVAPAALIG